MIAVRRWWAVSLLVCACLASAAENIDALAWLEDSQARIEDQRLTAADLGTITLYARGADPLCAAVAVGLLATQARVSGDSIQAITISAAALGVEPRALAAWQKAMQRAVVKNQPPRLYEPLPALPAAFPPTGVPVVLALAVALGSLDATADGAALVQKAILSGEGLAGVRAREAAGDLRCRPGSYADALDLYQGGLTAFNRLLAASGDKEAWRQPTPVEAALEARLLARVARTQRLWDEERYGPGFVAYREAERLRRECNRSAEALIAYEDLVSGFPNTIWAEAGAAYQVHCLFAIAQAPSTTLELAQARLDQEVKTATGRFEERRMAVASAAALLEAQTALAVAKDRKVRLVKQPRGTQAAIAAQQAIGRMLQKAEFGLYRGELLLAAATWSMEGALDPTASAKAYDRAWEWLEQVGGFDQQLAALAVPAAALEVAATPAQSLVVGDSGAPSRAEPAIGAVVNRQTCTWYLDDVREQVALGRAFLAFSAGRREEAEAWCLKSLTFGGAAGRMDRQGTWNDTSRLRWAIEHGWLYAHPEELALYQGRQRFIVLVADFRFCTQRFDRSRLLAERLLAGDFGALHGAALDYPRYLLAASHYWEGDRVKACADYQEVLAQTDGTLTEDRAALALGNLSWSDGVDPAITRAGHRALLKLAQSPRDNEFVLRARIIIGIRLIRTGQERDGLALLKRIPAAVDAYHTLAQGWIAAVEGLCATAPDPTAHPTNGF